MVVTSPMVSVVVPTKDRPELLRQAIGGILAQDYQGSIEVIVVFDTPADQADASLASDRTDRQVRVVTNTRSPGLAGARNSGVLVATGDLVAFCDDDDEWLPGKLSAQVAALAANPEANLVCCGIRVAYGDQTFDRVLPLDEITQAALLRDRMTELHPSTFLIRRSALLDGFGLVDEEIPGSYAEDYEFLLRAARQSALVNVRQPYVLVRWHERSHFAQRWDMIAEALTWLLDRYPEFATQPRGQARVAGQIAFACAASGRRRTALSWVRRTLRGDLAQPRAYLALAVASGALKPATVVRALHRRGRGI